MNSPWVGACSYTNSQFDQVRPLSPDVRRRTESLQSLDRTSARTSSRSIARPMVVMLTLVATPGRALAGLGLVALGLPVYAHYARRLGAEQAASWLGGEERVEERGG